MVTQKVITLVRRRPDLSQDGFVKGWLQSGAPAPSATKVARLVVGGHHPAWDGVELAWGTGTFAEEDVVGESSSFVVEDRVVSGADVLSARWASGDLGLVLIGLIEAVPGMSRESFRDYWWDRHRPLADQLVPEELAPLAYVHNYVVDGSYGEGTARWAGIGEMYEASMDVAKARGSWFASPAAAPLAVDEERFLVRSTRLVLAARGVPVRG